MNAEQFQALVQEVHDRVMGTQRNEAISEAHAALDALNETLKKWATCSTRKTQESQQLSEAKGVFEQVKGEVELECKFNPEIVNAKLKDDQERQLATYLAKLQHYTTTLSPIEQSYVQALDEHRKAQVAYDQANLEESIAAEQLKAAKYRCGMAQAVLQALSEK